jgi:TolB protein
MKKIPFLEKWQQNAGGAAEPIRKRERKKAKETEMMSEGRVEYLEQWRQRRVNRTVRRTVAVVLVLAAIVAWLTGAVGTSIARLQDAVDSIRIAVLPSQSYPQQTGLYELYQVESLSGAYVALGAEGCVVYSESGNKLNSIQAGYARPAIAAGKTRFVLYNRSGNELRVESRTQNLYVKTMENNIYTCAMSEDGVLAVATEDVRHVALLTVYSAEMEQLLQWSMTGTEGTPLRMAFATDNKRLAVAAVTTRDGQVQTNVYLLDTRKDDPVLLGEASGSVPQWIGWTVSGHVMVVFDDHAAVYSTSGAEKARLDFADETLVSLSTQTKGKLALLFENGQSCSVLLVDDALNVQYEGDVPAANRIVRDDDVFYLLGDAGVECFSADGTYQWTQLLDAKPLELLCGKRLLMLSTNIVSELTAPQTETEESASA